LWLAAAGRRLFQEIHLASEGLHLLVVKPRASVKMASGLPVSGVRVKTSS
jgi:hypothetical protein